MVSGALKDDGSMKVTSNRCEIDKGYVMLAIHMQSQRRRRTELSHSDGRCERGGEYAAVVPQDLNYVNFMQGHSLSPISQRPCPWDRLAIHHTAQIVTERRILLIFSDALCFLNFM